MWQAAGVDPVAHRHKLVCVGNTDFQVLRLYVNRAGQKKMIF